MSAVAFQAFGFEDQLVRVMDREGAPWFVAQDVCACLEITNHRDAVTGMDEDERDCVGITDAMQRDRQTTIVSESGVYVLIFRSRKPAAKRFRKWVTAEVLPTLRRTGSYAMPTPANDEMLHVRDVARQELEPSDFDERGMALALAVVREARQVWGRAVAQTLWRNVGLPQPDDRDERKLRARGRIDQSVHGWISDCTRPEIGACTAAQEMYRSYTTWCAAHELEPVAQTPFGKALTALGYTAKKSGPHGRVHRYGLVLI